MSIILELQSSGSLTQLLLGAKIYIGIKRRFRHRTGKLLHGELCEKQWQTTHLAAPGSYIYLVNHFGGGIRTFVRMINVLYTEPTLWEVHYTVRRKGSGSARRHAKGTPDVCSGETSLTEQPWRNPKQGELPVREGVGKCI